MKLGIELSKWGNVDCRQGAPEGWQIVRRNVWNTDGGLSDGDKELENWRYDFWTWIEREHIEHYRALIGFDKIEAKYFPTRHFSKPAHYRPIEVIIIPANIEIPKF